MEIKNTTLDDLAAVIGFSATLRLSVWFGDRGSLYIPNCTSESQFLAKLIGLPAATALSNAWGREHVSVPGMRQYQNDVVRRDIGEMFEHGLSSRKIAKQKGMTQRRVQQICRELECAELISIVAPETVAKPMPVTPGKDLQEAMGSKLNEQPQN